MKFIKIGLAVVFAIAYLGFGISSVELAPPYAVVFLDDENKTFIALPCMHEWQSRPTQTIDTVRRSTAGEAQRLGYQVDERCRDAGGYSEEGRSLTGRALERFGILSPLQHWWHRPYRTEDRTIVYPGK
jgi:hypothetical protein